MHCRIGAWWYTDEPLSTLYYVGIPDPVRVGLAIAPSVVSVNFSRGTTDSSLHTGPHLLLSP